MRIAVCTHDYPDYVSGPNVWLIRYIDGMKNSGNEVIVLFTRGGEGEKFRYISEVKARGTPCYVYAGPRYTEDKIRWILSVVREESPDFFIPNFDFPAYYAARWIRESGIPTIGLLRSDDKIYMGIIDQFIRTPGPFQPSAIVCVSKFLLELAVSQGTGDILYRHIPSGTPVPEQIVRKQNDSLKLVYTGRLIEQQKRASDLAAALCHATRQVPGTKAVIYGSGEALNSVRHILRTEGDGLPVRYGGVIDSAAMQQTLLENHVFVLLSDYEGLPTSVMEAMACGLVPVCLNIRSGIPELIEHDKTGLLVEDRSADFINAISRLKNEPGLWERLSEGARSRIESDYSFQISITKWLNLFTELGNRNIRTKRRIRIPVRIKLPPPHPAVSGAEPRWPGFLKYYGNRAKKLYNRSIG